MKVVIIAGRDKLAVQAAVNLKNSGHTVIAFTFEDEVAVNMATVSDGVYEFKITQVGKVLSTLKKLGIEAVVFAGKFHRLVMDKNQLRFDLKAIWIMARLKDRRDDTIMNAIVAEIEKLGIKILSQAEVLHDLLIQEGVLTKTKPTQKQMNDVEFGFTMAKGIAGLDIGQTIVVINKGVIAVEAAEGTDQTILRAGGLLPKGGFTLIKVAKPNQSEYFDMPVIGMTTLQNLVSCKGSVIAIEAGQTFIVDQHECVDFLDNHGVVLMGYKPIS